VLLDLSLNAGGELETNGFESLVKLREEKGGKRSYGMGGRLKSGTQ